MADVLVSFTDKFKNSARHGTWNPTPVVVQNRNGQIEITIPAMTYDQEQFANMINCVHGLLAENDRMLGPSKKEE